MLRLRRPTPVLGLLVLALVLGTCSPRSTPAPTPPPPGPTPPPSNPCAATSQEPESAGRPDQVVARKGPRVDSGGRWGVLTDQWKHRAAAARRTLSPSSSAAVEDQGEITVLRDEGDLVLSANLFDLTSAGLRFTPNAAGGYDAQRIDATFRSGLGTRVSLEDDDSSMATVPFTFTFYGKPQTQAFVNSDGNITFGEPDAESTERDVARLLTGPPRVAPFLADLDPQKRGGVFLNASSSAFTVTWCSIYAFGTTKITTVQATLLPDGIVEMKYGADITIGGAIVGVSPGRTSAFTPVDLTAASSGTGPAALGERFADRPELDFMSVSRKFYQTHADLYDQLVIWADRSFVEENTFAFEVTVANEIQGIGINVFDDAREFGSAGRLRSYVFMDSLTKFPDDPMQRIPGLGENNTLSVLGQEVGHRWLARLEIRDFRGQQSQALLGRDNAHWSFFFDTDASVMEGNDIQDLGGGSFRTVAAVQRYSPLDQYAMGLIPESAVPPFFYVDGPVNISIQADKDSSPRVGVTFNGTRREALIQDVIAIQGPRVPSSLDSPKVHRQAFLYVVAAPDVDRNQVTKVDLIRRSWETFFGNATSGRGRAETRLRPPT